MTDTIHTEASVLAHHGIAPLDATDNARTDAARDHGLLWACMGCGSIATGPAGMTTSDYYAASAPGTRNLVAEWAECCGDAHSVLF